MNDSGKACNGLTAMRFPCRQSKSHPGPCLTWHLSYPSGMMAEPIALIRHHVPLSPTVQVLGRGGEVETIELAFEPVTCPASVPPPGMVNFRVIVVRR